MSRLLRFPQLFNAASPYAVYAFPTFRDNYAYLVHCRKAGVSFAVDAVSPDAIHAHARELGAPLVAVFTTHHHLDHCGGNERLAELLAGTGAEFIAGDERVAALTSRLTEETTLSFGDVRVTGFPTPGHTTGHFSYHVRGPAGPGSVFTGDTLFIAGCGRLFEGTAADMAGSLARYAALPPDTLVWVGHEYTRANLRFALSVEPENAALRAYARDVGLEGEAPTIPSSVAREGEINPFWRATVPARFPDIAARDAVDCLAQLRARKDDFAG